MQSSCEYKFRALSTGYSDGRKEDIPTELSLDSESEEMKPGSSSASPSSDIVALADGGFSSLM